MDKKIIDLTKNKSIPQANLLAFISVETGGLGFNPKTNKLIIQFEPRWFKKKEPFAPSGSWSVNGVDVQSNEWVAFNNAYSIDPTSAMESTSIGLGQILGLHYKRLGFKSVNEMWDDAKKGVENQINQLIKFIETDDILRLALIACNWHVVASRFNGKFYKQLAEKIGREPYNISMEKEYNKFKVVNN